MRFANLALGVLTNSPGTSGTSVILSSGEGLRFLDPAVAGQYFATLGPSTEQLHLGNAEIVLVTAKSGDTLTVTRAQRGTTAKNVSSGFICFQGVYWQDITPQNGWIDAEDTLVYASASTFTIVGQNRTNIYQPGTKLWISQTTSKFFYVVSSLFSGGNTTVTITGGIDYTLANASITNPRYSYSDTPQNFPDIFQFTPGFTGFSSPPGGNMFFSIKGRVCFIISDAKIGTSNATTFTITGMPVPASTQFNKIPIIVRDANADLMGTVRFSSSTTLTIETGASGGSWTASGNKGTLSFNLFFRI